MNKTDSKPLGISELVRLIGDENIEVQNLAQNMTDAKDTKTCGKITFATSKANAQQLMQWALGRKQEKVALVLWFPGPVRMGSAGKGHVRKLG